MHCVTFHNTTVYKVSADGTLFYTFTVAWRLRPVRNIPSISHSHLLALIVCIFNMSEFRDRTFLYISYMLLLNFLANIINHRWELQRKCSGYGLWNRRIVFRLPAGAKPSLKHPDHLLVLSNPYSVDTGGPLWGKNNVAWSWPPTFYSRGEERWNSTFTRVYAFMACTGIPLPSLRQE
jgi:hypothetical protein